MSKSKIDAWTPICPVCRTESIAYLHGQHQCSTCGRVWDGSERTETDVFVIRPEDTTEDVVMDVLEHYWPRWIAADPGNYL